MVEARLFPLVLEEDETGAYVLIFGPGYIRLIQDGAYVVEGPYNGTLSGGQLITSTQLFAGNLIFIDGISEPLVVLSYVASVATLQNTVGEIITDSLGTVSFTRAVTLSNPYAQTEFYDIGYAQARGRLYLAHHNHPPRVIYLNEFNEWRIDTHFINQGKPLSENLYEITVTDTGKFVEYVRITAGGSGYDSGTSITIDDPTGTGFEGILTVESGVIVAVTIVDGGKNYTDPTVVLTNDGGGTGATFEVGLSDTDAGLVVTVSAIVNGKETGPMRPKVVSGIPNFTQTAASVTYSWTPVPDATKYVLYRSLVFPDAADAHIGYTLGFIGETIGTEFTDVNIQPDFTRTPIIYNNPFAPGAITSINVTSFGSGYNATDFLEVTDESRGEFWTFTDGLPVETTAGDEITFAEISLTATGEGFVGYPIVSKGEIIGVYVAHHGENYVNPTVTVICNDTTPPDPGEIPGGGGEGAPPLGPTGHLILATIDGVFALVGTPEEGYARLVIPGRQFFRDVGDQVDLELEDGTILRVLITDIIYEPENDVTSWLLNEFNTSFDEQVVIFRELNEILYVDTTEVTLVSGNNLTYAE